MIKKTLLRALRINHRDLLSSLLVTVYLLTLASCKSKEQPDVSQSNQTDSTIAQPAEEGNPIPLKNTIRYSGATAGDTKNCLETFEPLTSLYALASASIHLKDSIEQVRGTQQLTDPQDSLIFIPYETRAYQAILAYQKLMASGPSLQSGCPNFTKLDRLPDSGDSSSNLLPPTGVSNFLSHGNFFFLGGAPFLLQLQANDNEVYTDAHGNPETRFESSITENGNYFLNSIYHAKNISTTISFGPPLGSYDSGPQEVNGIGSLIHEFVNRIPVLFITEEGLVPAHLISVTVKLIGENLGCVSDAPSIVFACSKNIEAMEILGIYIPYDSTPVTSCKITRHSNSVWTADLNNDGIPELACVPGVFEGIASDAMAEALWFINIQGDWKIIEWAQELDCT